MTISYAEFGHDLLTTYDLDPVYPMLIKANLSERLLKRWLLAYWVYYSCGVAATVAGCRDFYGTLIMGEKLRWPRGHERRHMRGDNLLSTVKGLKNFGDPEKVVDAMTTGTTVEAVSNSVQAFRGFGPWIGWKVADMVERVMQKPVDFSKANLYIYRDPVKGAALVKFGDQNHPITEDELEAVVHKSIITFRDYKAPPYADRPVNVQEVETVLCKYKSHINGHYPLGNDCRDVAHGLGVEWGDLAQHLLSTLREVVAYEV